MHIHAASSVFLAVALAFGAMAPGSSATAGRVETVQYVNANELAPSNCLGTAAPGFGISTACSAVQPGDTQVTVTIADVTGLPPVVGAWAKDADGDVIGFVSVKCNKPSFTINVPEGAVLVGVDFRLQSAPLTCSSQRVPGTTGTVTFAW